MRPKGLYFQSQYVSLTFFWVRFFKIFKGMWVLRGVRSQQIPSKVAISRSYLSCNHGPSITLEMKMMYCLHDFLLLLWSLRKNYGSLYSLKLGSYKFVIAEDVASVKEVLVKKSADYAGRPPFHSFLKSSMGMYRIVSVNSYFEVGTLIIIVWNYLDKPFRCR